MRTLTGAALLAAALAGTTATGGAQASGAAGTLEQRVAAVRDGRVEVRFAAREGICGDGRTYVRLGNSWHGTWDGESRRRACVPGPVRVVARVRGGVVDELKSFVGPEPARRDSDVVDLGMVPSREGARWLLGVARTGPGRAASKAIMPAVLADSADVWRDLLAIARDTATRPRAVRNDAAHWLSRFAGAVIEGLPPGQLDLAEDEEDESDAVEAKKSAVFALSQLRSNEGVPALITVARTNREPAVRRSALFWLGQSGDTRGLAVMEEVLTKGRN